jgi:hypothetical protein
MHPDHLGAASDGSPLFHATGPTVPPRPATGPLSATQAAS